MNKIVAVKHDKDGTLYNVKLDNGKVLDMTQAVALASVNELEGVSTFTTRTGDLAIRSNRGHEGYSLHNLPEFE